MPHFDKITAALMAAALLGGASLAQAQTTPHTDHAAPAAAAGADQTPSNPSTAAYEAANAKMHQGMAITFTGDADRDYLAGMIAHHQGAVDMSEVVLKYGKDPKVRQLAQEIIKAQKKEIEQMESWLKAMEEGN